MQTEILYNNKKRGINSPIFASLFPTEIMKHYTILTISFCMLLLSTLASCGSGEDYTVITVSPSTCVVTNVQLGKIPCIVNIKTAEGKDSVYVASITGSNYPMSIDHYGGRIFNVDSLPYGCDAAKVTFNTLASSGTLAINSLSQEVDTFFVATDSTDFRTPRKVTVYALDGIAKRSYMLEVRVHQEEGDVFKWQEMSTGVAEFTGIEWTGALAHEGILYAFGEENDQPVVMTALATAPTTWNKENTTHHVEAPLAYNGCFYALSKGALLQSEDGKTWKEVPTNLSTQLLTIAAGSTALYGITETGFVVSTDAYNWTSQKADEPAFLPTENCSATCLPSPIDASFEDIIVVGSRNGSPVVWKLNVDKTGTYDYTWNYYPENPLNNNPCPELPMRKIFAYDGGTLLLGSDISGNSMVRLSRDNGRTWEEKHIPQLDMITSPFVATVDSNHFVWILSDKGLVLKGRYNRLGWKQQDRIFTKE